MSYDFDTVSAQEALSLRDKLDLLIITAVEIETRHAWDRMTAPPGKSRPVRTQIGVDVFVIGMFGVYLAAHVQCEMGSGGVSASALTTAAAIAIWDPSILGNSKNTIC